MKSGDRENQSGNEGDRIHARISPLLDAAIRLYMRENHLENRSEVLKSVLGKFLEQQGYLVKTKDGYKVRE